MAKYKIKLKDKKRTIEFPYIDNPEKFLDREDFVSDEIYDYIVKGLKHIKKLEKENPEYAIESASVLLEESEMELYEVSYDDWCETTKYIQEWIQEDLERFIDYYEYRE